MIPEYIVYLHYFNQDVWYMVNKDHGTSISVGAPAWNLI